MFQAFIISFSFSALKGKSETTDNIIGAPQAFSSRVNVQIKNDTKEMNQTPELHIIQKNLESTKDSIEDLNKLVNCFTS